MARDQFLAGGGSVGSVQDSLWRISGRTATTHVLASPHARALGTHDPRGARKVPSGNARPMRYVHRAGCSQGLTRGPRNAGNVDRRILRLRSIPTTLSEVNCVSGFNIGNAWIS